MRLVTANEAVEIQGVGDQSQFSIKMNAKAFRVLSDTLYQNKIGSIVREICCNAMDSHIAADKRDVPFTIHMPDRFEPWFSVIDYGIGLSRDDVRKIYTTYFESTKDESNEMVGAFGLGSKTPFAYTDAFTVTSTYNGERTVYSAYIAQNGMPTIAEVSTAPTDDINGVEIQVPVSDSDIHKFKDEIKTQLAFFAVKPNIVNGSVEWMKMPDSFVYQSDSCSVYQANYGSAFRGIYITQGQVGYPVNLTQIKERCDEDIGDFLSKLNAYFTVLNFDIGDIEVTASREGIQYTAYTINSIIRNIKVVMDEIEKYANDRMAAITTEWEKVHYFNESREFFATIVNKINFTNASRVWGGRFAFDVTKFCSDNKIGISSPHRGHRYNSKLTLVSRADHLIMPQNDMRFILRDTGDAPIARLEKYLNDNQIASTYYDKVIIVNGEDINSFNETEFFDAIGNPPNAEFIKLSDCEKPPRQSSASGSRGTYAVTKYSVADLNAPQLSMETKGSGWNRESSGSVSDFDKENVLLVRTYRGSVTNISNRNATLAIERYNTLKQLERIDMGDYIVIAVNEKMHDKLINDGYACFCEYIHNQFNEISSSLEAIIRSKHKKQNVHYVLNKHFDAINLMASAGVETAIKLKHLHDKTSNADGMGGIAYKLDISLPNSETLNAVITVEREVEKLMDRFPLLKQLYARSYYIRDFMSSSEAHDEIAFYIKAKLEQGA